MKTVKVSIRTVIIKRKDLGVALTTRGMTNSSKESIMNFSTHQPSEYQIYLKSYEWRNKKREWIDSGRPAECWACGEIMPPDYYGFNFHHITYANLGNENLNDLVLLCKSDHRDLEKEYKILKQLTLISLAQWTWIYIAMSRANYKLPPINKSKIGKYLGAFNE